MIQSIITLIALLVLGSIAIGVLIGLYEGIVAPLRRKL